MTICDKTLTLDLGPVGLQGDQHPFLVTLDSEPLAKLVSAAADACRVYEIMLIGRPGDIWEYVQVTPAGMPPQVAEKLELARQKARAGETQGSWPDGKVPFRAFDRLFHSAWDDMEPEDEAWWRARNGSKMRSYALVLLASLSAARNALESGSSLVRHELARIRTNAHPYSFLGRQEAIEASREHLPNNARHTEAFYAKLGALLNDGDVSSVFYRGEGDYRVLRMLCEEQRNRVPGTDAQPARAFVISALVDHEVNSLAWDADVTYYSEGVGRGYLHIEESSLGGVSVKDLVEQYSKIGPGGYIFSCRDEGQIRGYQVESGDGWHLYRSEVSARMSPPLRQYHNVWSLMLAQENGELSNEQVIDIMSQWEVHLSKKDEPG